MGYGVYEQCQQDTGARRLQYGALPYRVSSGERAEFMLVTSRETRRWIIPKGWPKRGKSPHRSAAREAFEEAGIVGAVGRQTVGSFSYEKRLKNGRSVECEVRVFPLQVKRQSKAWPEKFEEAGLNLVQTRGDGQRIKSQIDRPRRVLTESIQRFTQLLWHTLFGHLQVTCCAQSGSKQICILAR